MPFNRLLLLELLIQTDEMKEYYEKYTPTYNGGDAGVDLYFPDTITINGKDTVLVDMKIKCQMKSIHDSDIFSYLLYPRSSIYKTPLRLANSVGVIDKHYAGNIKVALDNTSEKPYTIKKGERLVQLCHPSLDSFRLTVVDEIDRGDNSRGENGFGSTGC